VLIDLQKDTVFAYGKQFRIQPGSALTADIIIDRRTFAQWLLDPIFAIRGHL
jgi:membrane fusion protein